MSDGRQAGLGAALVVLIFVGAVVKFIWIILAGFAGIALSILAIYLMYRFDNRRAIRDAKIAAIARRADEQHAQILAGDDRGIYGAYPPAVPPGPATVRRPQVGENWADYLAETRRKALAG